MLLALTALLVVCTRVDAATCTVSTTSVLFGAYNVFTSSPTDSVGTVEIHCQGNAKDVAVAISKGDGATFASRRLAKAGEQLFYNLYREASRTSIWGDGTGGSQMRILNSVPNGTTVPLTMYGRIPPGQDVSTGAYSDTLTVTVNY
jgi:spore coat protein U-like protein